MRRRRRQGQEEMGHASLSVPGKWRVWHSNGSSLRSHTSPAACNGSRNHVGGSAQGVLEGRDSRKGRSPRASEVEAGLRCPVAHRCKNMFDI